MEEAELTPEMIESLRRQRDAMKKAVLDNVPENWKAAIINAQLAKNAARAAIHPKPLPVSSATRTASTTWGQNVYVTAGPSQQHIYPSSAVNTQQFIVPKKVEQPPALLEKAVKHLLQFLPAGAAINAMLTGALPGPTPPSPAGLVNLVVTLDTDRIGEMSDPRDQIIAKLLQAGIALMENPSDPDYAMNYRSVAKAAAITLFDGKVPQEDDGIKDAIQ